MIQAVIFDWAGTTVDYGCFAPVQAFQEAFAHHGVPVTLEETRKPMGMLKRDHIRTMLRMERIARAWEETHGRPAGEEDVEAVYAQFEPKLFSILDRFSTPKPFAVETAARPAGDGAEDRLHHRLYRLHDAHCRTHGRPDWATPLTSGSAPTGWAAGPSRSLHDL